MIDDPAPALLERWRAAGDERALAELFEHHRPMIAGICRGVLGDPAAVDEAVQDTFVTLVRAAGGITGHPGPWLRRCALNAALQYRRAHRRHRDRTLPLPAAEPAVEEGDEDLPQRVRACLGRLAAEERDLIERVFYRNQSQREIARDIHLSQMGVSKRLRRTLDRLRERLAEDSGPLPSAGYA